VLRDAQSDFYQTYSQAESLGNSITGHSPDVAPAPASESNGLNGYQFPSPSTSNDKVGDGANASAIDFAVGAGDQSVPLSNKILEHASSDKKNDGEGRGNDARLVFRKIVMDPTPLVHKYVLESMPLVRKYPFESALVKRTLSGPKVRKIENYARMKWEKEQYEQETRNNYFEMMRQQRDFENAHPTTVMEDLILHTPRRAEGTILRISVPNNALPALLFDADENILEIKHRTGCDIDLLEAEDNNDFRTLLLSGPSICVTMAAARIFEVVPDAVTKSTNPVFIPPAYSTRSINYVPSSEEKDASLVKPRYYLTYANDSITTAPRRADSVPQPDKWTSNSLEAYVRSLTRIKMTNHVHRFLYQEGEEHQEIVRELLSKIFDLDECREVMTVTTVNEAMSFLMKHHKIPEVCDIFGKAQLNGFRMNTESFNIMLRGAAKIRDLNTFGYLIRIMVRLGHRPNSGTWVAFMSVLDSPKAIWRVFQVMRERGLFHEEGLMTDVCTLLVPHELRYCLGKEKPMLIPEFIVYMTKRYGESWLTLSGANQMLDELAIRGLMSECWLLIEHMISQNITPNVVSVNTILTHCSRLDGLKAAVEFFQRLTKLFRFKPDSITYSILLRAAWDACCYATSRTVWQYACLDACVPWQMRRRVGDAVITSFQTQNSANPALHMDVTPAKLWDRTAGLFVVTGEHKKFPLFVPPVPDMPVMSFEDARLHAQHALNEDLNLFRRWKPAQSFSKLLEDSIAVDTGFRTMEGKTLDERMEWLLKYAPIVKRKKRNYELARRSTESYFKGRIIGYYSKRASNFRALAARNYWKERLRRAAKWKNDRWIRSLYSESRSKPKPQFNKNEFYSKSRAHDDLAKAKRENLRMIERDREIRTPAEIIAERALLVEKREVRAALSAKYFQKRPAGCDEKVPVRVVQKVTSMPNSALTTPQVERGQMATQKPRLPIKKREDATHWTQSNPLTGPSGITTEERKKKGISQGRNQGQEGRDQVATQKAPLPINKREKGTPGTHSTHWNALTGSSGMTTEKDKENEISKGRKQGQEERGQVTIQKAPLPVKKHDRGTPETHSTNWKALAGSSGMTTEKDKENEISKGRKQGQEERGQVAIQKAPLSIKRCDRGTPETHLAHWKALTGSSGMTTEKDKENEISKGRKQGQEERGQVAIQKAPLSIKRCDRGTPETHLAHWKALTGSCGITIEKEKESEIPEGRKQAQKMPKIASREAPRKSQQRAPLPQLVREFPREFPEPVIRSIRLQEKFNYIAAQTPPPLVRPQYSGPMSELEKAIVKRRKQAQKKIWMPPLVHPTRLIRTVKFVRVLIRRINYTPVRKITSRRRKPRPRKRRRKATRRSKVVVRRLEFKERPKMTPRGSSVVD
jgi:hypothetical protein